MKGVKYIAPFWDHCYSEDTEVLTDSGWKFFKGLKGSEKLATLSEDHTLEYHVPQNLIKVPWSGELLNFYSPDGVDLLVSPNHNMYVQTDSAAREFGQGPGGWRLEKAEDCFGKSRFYKKTAPNYFVKGPEFVEVVGRAIPTMDWLKFLGYYLSEGSSTTTIRKDYIVQLRQTKDTAVLEDMALSLSKVSSGKVNIRPDGRAIVNDKNLCLYLKTTFGHCYTKYIPRDILNGCSREQLKVLYNALMVGDGKTTPEDQSGGSYYATSSVQLRDDFQELQFKCGFSGDYSVGAFPGDSSKLADGRVITATETLWKVSVRRKRAGTSIWSSGSQRGLNSRAGGFKTVPYEGEIFCATVKNHTLYVRRNGKAVWCGNSGYGEASRNYILSLYKAKVPLTIEARRFEANPPPVGTAVDRDIFTSLEGKDIDYDVVIVHLTPDLVPDYVKSNPGKYVINYTAWETSLLHPYWARCCQTSSEIWVPCDWNIQALRDSGVTCPITKVHHGVDPDAYASASASDIELANQDSDTFNFYSIFQWNARKNPEGLIRAYLNAFKADEKVKLYLKTYIGRGLNPVQEVAAIRERVTRIRSDMQLPSYPKISLITDSLSTAKIRALNLFGDCYISLTRGEGFGLTMLEAGLAGKPVIATAAGGNMEYMNEDNSFPVRSTWDYVSGMAEFNPWYWGNQQWFQPNIPHAAELMRYVYDNREEAAAKGEILKAHIKNNFSWEVVAKQMLDRLQEL